MLFFFGTGTSTISSHALTGVPCVNCGYDRVGVAIYSRYLHIFWIPVLPLGKHCLSQCANCKQLLKDGQLPASYQAPAQAWQQAARLPVSNYIVPALAGVLFAVLMVVGALSSPRRPAASSSALASTERPADYDAQTQPVADTPASFEVDPAINEAKLADPQTGDMYVMHNSGGGYTVMRVARVAPDTLYFQGSLYRPATPAATSADSVAKRLMNYVTGIPRAGVQHMNETKMLTIVRR